MTEEQRAHSCGGDQNGESGHLMHFVCSHWFGGLNITYTLSLFDTSKLLFTFVIAVGQAPLGVYQI